MSNKRKYSTGLIIKYKLGLLPRNIELQIHRNTRMYWQKNISISNIFGIENFEEDEDNIKLITSILEIERLKKLVLLLTNTYFVMLSIVNSIDKKNKYLFSQKTNIINIIDEFKDIFDLEKICNLFTISTKKYHTWKNMNNCVNPLKEYCKKIVPNQISFKEQKIIREYMLNPNYKNWGITNIFYRMIEEGRVAMSLQTFRNYANSYFPKRKLLKKKIKRLGIRATKPFEKLHMDVTIYRPLDNTKVYIYFIVDNFSRKILAWEASLELKASISFKNLENACNNYNLFDNNTELIVDGGSENKAEVNNFILNHKNWKKIVAQKDIIFSNSIVEAVNKIMKYHYIFKQDFANINELIKLLPIFIDDYNNRPHSVLKLSPNDVAKGKIFDKEKYKEQIKQAKKQRLIDNKACNKCDL